MAERLENLRRYDEAWRSPCWSHNIRFRVPAEGRMESKQGVMLFAKETAHPEHGLEVQQLPSDTRNIPPQSWTIQPHVDTEPGKEEGEVYEVRRRVRRIHEGRLC